VSNTPRTDAFWFERNRRPSDAAWLRYARTLERELAEKNDLITGLPTICRRYEAQIDGLRRELAEARLDGECYHSLCGLIRANPNALAGELLEWFKGESAIDAAMVAEEVPK
jgi:hypothetical protein